eukprot:2707923-Pleurochrysis_carterae.AAC.4
MVARKHAMRYVAACTMAAHASDLCTFHAKRLHGERARRLVRAHAKCAFETMRAHAKRVVEMRMHVQDRAKRVHTTCDERADRAFTSRPVKLKIPDFPIAIQAFKIACKDNGKRSWVSGKSLKLTRQACAPSSRGRLASRPPWQMPHLLLHQQPGSAQTP